MQQNPGSFGVSDRPQMILTDAVVDAVLGHFIPDSVALITELDEVRNAVADYLHPHINNLLLRAEAT
jgi:hypothetical protein